MRDDSQSTFATNGPVEGVALEKPWRPSWTGLREKPSGLNDETLSALLLLVLSRADENQHMVPASDRVVSLLSQMDTHPRGVATDYAARAGLIKRLSEALTGLRAELD